MNLKYILAVVSLLWTCSLYSQLIFVQKEHDFGNIIWYTPSHATITVMNKGPRPVSISEVLASNSAVKVSWPNTPILPGAFVEIAITIQPPVVGHFDHTLSLYADSIKEMQDRMHLKGNVLMQSMQERNTDGFPYHVSKLYLSTDNIEFDEVKQGQFPQQVVSVYNAGSDIWQPELMHLPKYLTMEAIPTRILPGRVGKIILTLDSRQLTTMGLTQTSVYVGRFPGDNVGKDNELSVSAVLVPSYDSTSVVQRELAPQLELPSTIISLPPFGNKKKTKGKLLFTNTGKSSLEISNLQVFNPAVEVRLSKAKIAPGETAILMVTLRRDLIGASKGRLRILMITNDPRQSKVIFDVMKGKESVK